MTQGKVIISSKILKRRTARLLVGLQLEIIGFKPIGKSCRVIIEEEYGLTGTPRQVYKQLKKIHDKDHEPANTGTYTA